MRYLKWIVIVFVIFCGFLVAKSGFFTVSPETFEYPILLQQTISGGDSENNEATETSDAEATENTITQPAKEGVFSVEHSELKNVTLGSTDVKSGYKFQIELTSRGAAIEKATFSEFNDRDRKNPQPLNIISPAKQTKGPEVLAMANREFMLPEYDKQLRLENLFWQSYEPETKEDGSQSVRFEAIVKEQNTNQPFIKIIKTYTIRKDSYLLECDIKVENLSDSKEQIRFNFYGPSGLEKEDFRTDMRSTVAFYTDSEGQVQTEIANTSALRKANNSKSLDKTGSNFVWTAAINKYFAAILVPLPDANQVYCDWVSKKTGLLYDPNGTSKKVSRDAIIGVNLNIANRELSAAGEDGSTKDYNFRLYIGPKEKSIFDKNEQYKNWGLVNVISFNSCFCCPNCLINPLAFGILAAMKWMYGLWPHNYGIVIIILVFLMRLAIHPLTKKSQVSMSKMGKLGPKVEAIKKKYANDQKEMNKKMMELYKEQGASPVMGMLPMFVQMPIWIALWSAVNTSVALRGEGFLPFWITDLSTPDAAFSFPTPLVIPLLGWHIASINLLPILMGVAFYFQQKLMPSQTGAVSNPQMEQQQKMMKIMMPLMFPIMLYNGPSGVNLYIMSSTFAGVIEQTVIRKHIQEREAEEEKGKVSVTKKTGGKVKKKKPKPFFKS
ncbi:MAG: membrane protein insertase YidC [Sedimentisphaerales bacterium]|nr:membrane protein insertase YidC [Sedimentisphaerales bacterium]